MIRGSCGKDQQTGRVCFAKFFCHIDSVFPIHINVEKQDSKLLFCGSGKKRCPVFVFKKIGLNAALCKLAFQSPAQQCTFIGKVINDCNFHLKTPPGVNVIGPDRAGHLQNHTK